MNFNFNGNYPNRKTKRKTMKIETRERIFKKLWYNIKSCNLIKVGTLEGGDRENRAEEIFEEIWPKFFHCKGSYLNRT